MVMRDIMLVYLDWLMARTRVKWVVSLKRWCSSHLACF